MEGLAAFCLEIRRKQPQRKQWIKENDTEQLSYKSREKRLLLKQQPDSRPSF
jgi:hypothetical protein